MNRLAMLCSLVVCLAGCESVFNPKGPYEEKIVVYCILSNKWDEGIARVYRSYNPSGLDPFENADDTPISGAAVVISKDDSVFVFRDTTIERRDKTRYTSDIQAYVYRPLNVAPGKTYQLNVNTKQFGGTISQASVPDSGNFLGVTFVGDFRGFLLRLSPQAKGFRLRFYIEFDAAGETHMVEVPSYLNYYFSVTRFGGVYPILQRRSNTVSRSTGNAATDTAFFDLLAHQTIMASLEATYVDPVVRRWILVFTQVEDNLYNYYNIANAFQDRFFVRLDEPDYTNIQSGYGVFGAFIEQTFIVQPQ